MRVGFAGLGRMGVRMAENLVAAGHDVTVWNRSAEKAEGFAAAHRADMFGIGLDPGVDGLGRDEAAFNGEAFQRLDAQRGGGRQGAVQVAVKLCGLVAVEIGHGISLSRAG